MYKDMTGTMDLFPETARQQKIVNFSRDCGRGEPIHWRRKLISEDDFSNGYELTRPLPQEQPWRACPDHIPEVGRNPWNHHQVAIIMWICNYFEAGRPAIDPRPASGGKGFHRQPLAALPFFDYLLRYFAILALCIRYQSISHSTPCSPPRHDEATLRLKCNGKFTLLRFPDQPRR